MSTLTARLDQDNAPDQERLLFILGNQEYGMDTRSRTHPNSAPRFRPNIQAGLVP